MVIWGKEFGSGITRFLGLVRPSPKGRPLQECLSVVVVCCCCLLSVEDRVRVRRSVGRLVGRLVGRPKDD